MGKQNLKETKLVTPSKESGFFLMFGYAVRFSFAGALNFLQNWNTDKNKISKAKKEPKNAVDFIPIDTGRGITPYPRKCSGFYYIAEEEGRPHKETLKERQYLARCFRA